MYFDTVDSPPPVMDMDINAYVDTTYNTLPLMEQGQLFFGANPPPINPLPASLSIVPLSDTSASVVKDVQQVVNATEPLSVSASVSTSLADNSNWEQNVTGVSLCIFVSLLYMFAIIQA